MDTRWADIPAYSKATLGDSATAGGNVVPPNVLEAVVEIATANNPYRQLLTVVDAGFVAGPIGIIAEAGERTVDPGR